MTRRRRRLLLTTWTPKPTTPTNNSTSGVVVIVGVPFLNRGCRWIGVSVAEMEPTVLPAADVAQHDPCHEQRWEAARGSITPGRASGLLLLACRSSLMGFPNQQ
jgi:hypothetical protein